MIQIAIVWAVCALVSYGLIRNLIVSPMYGWTRLESRLTACVCVALGPAMLFGVAVVLTRFLVKKYYRNKEFRKQYNKSSKGVT